MSNKTVLRILIIAGVLALALFIGLALGASAAELAASDTHSADAIMQRTTTISVASGARVRIYPEAGHTSGEVRWKCAGGKYRAAADSIRPNCRRITLTSRIWFDYEIVRSKQGDA